MTAESSFGQTHADECCEGSGFEESTIGRLHALQYAHCPRDEEPANGREQSSLLVHLTNADGNQGRNGITHHRQVEEAEEPLRQRGKFERESRNLLPVADHTSQGTHHENGNGER